MLILHSHWTRRPHHRPHGKCHIKVSESRILSFITSSLCLKVFGFVQCSRLLGIFCVRFSSFLLILQTGWELLKASWRIFCTAVMRFNSAELPQSPVLSCDSIPERWKEPWLFHLLSPLHPCSLLFSAWRLIHACIHTHTYIDTKPHRVAPYWSPVGSEGFFDTNHSKPYNGKISSQPVCYEQRQKPDVTDLLGSFPQVWGAWDEMAALCPLHFREKKECIRSTAPHTCLVQPPSSLGQPEPSAPASPILSYYSNHNITLKKS